MSLLTLIREQAIHANVQQAGEAYKYLTEAIQKDAKNGANRGQYSVEQFNHVERTTSVKALQLQGFQADFTDESHRDVFVSWLPRHPR